MAQHDDLDRLLALLRRPGLREALDDDQTLRRWAAAQLTDRRRTQRRWLGLSLAVLAALATALHCQDALGPARPEVALVNGQPILRSVVAENAEQRLGTAMLETALLSEVLRQAAAKEGLAPSDADIDAALARLRDEQFRGDAQAFDRWLHGGGHRESVVRREVAAQLAAFRLRARGVRLTEKDLRTYHAEHRDAYRRPASYVYRIIYVPWPERDGQRRPDNEALDVAKRELARIRAGEDFDAAARRVSEDPMAERTGGRIGPQPADLLPAEFRAPFKDAKPNQVIGEPVRFGMRYVLLQFLARQEAFEGEFEQVRATVESDYLLGKLPPQAKFLNDLMARAKIEIVDPRYQGQPIVGRWSSPNGVSLPGWLTSE